MEYTPIPQSDIEEMNRSHEFLSQVLVFAPDNETIELVRRIDGDFVTVTIDTSTGFTTLADLIHEAEQNLR